MRQGRLVLVFVFAAALVVGGGLFAFTTLAQTNDEIQEQIDASTREIQRLKAEIAELEKSLSDTSKQRQSLQTAINGLNLNIQKLSKSISLTQAEVSQKDKEIYSIAGTIESTTEQIARSQAQVANSLRELDDLSSQPMVIKILGGGTLSTLFDEATTLDAVRLDLQEHIY